MNPASPTRFASRFSLLVLLLTTAGGGAQSPAKPSAAIPMSPATSTLPPTPPTAAPTASPFPVPNNPRKAVVTYDSGLLAVKADNSSLNQILREISRLTGMKITGGVSEERVFCNYDPMPTARLLGLLLNGTGTNMIFVQASPTSSAELFLTARLGGPTPPSPRQANSEGEDEASGENVPPPVATQPPVAYRPAADAQPSAPPNGIRNPQQIFDQLQRNHQQADRPQ